MKILSIISLSIFLLTGCNQAKTVNDNQKESNVTSQAEEQKSAPAAVAPASPTDTTFTFDNYEAGKLPSDWSQYFTGRGESTEWKVVDDKGNKVMAQLSKDNPNYHFNVVVFNGLEAKNVELTVRLKGVAGRMDQGGGFVWRYKDAGNYYVVRANPLEDNVVLYKVKDGKRTDLPVLGKGRTYGVDVKPLGSGWNTLKLMVKDDLFTVYLNDEQLFQVKDETFKNKGKVGLWTKADAVSYFDDFQVEVTE